MGCDGLRHFYYSKWGLRAHIAFNFFMVMTSSFVVFYELMKLMNRRPPLWFMIVDIGIVLLFVFEVMVKYLAEKKAYFRKKENLFDFFVMIFSVFTCFFYILETTRFADDFQAIMLSLRIIRDIVRVGRVFFFLKTLRKSIVEFRDLVDEEDEFGGLEEPDVYKSPYNAFRSPYNKLNDGFTLNPESSSHRDGEFDYLHVSIHHEQEHNSDIEAESDQEGTSLPHVHSPGYIEERGLTPLLTSAGEGLL